MPDLVLYTNSFPYSDAETFLETEILFLSKSFQKIYIWPMEVKGSGRELPVNVQVMPPLFESRCSKIAMYLSGIFNISVLYSETTLRRNLSGVPFSKAIKYLGYAVWLKRKLRKKLYFTNAIHYSYWMNYWAAALALLKREGIIPVFISRAHRYDLYIKTGEPALDFLKPFTLRYIKRLYLISENGLNFVKSYYPEYSDKYSLSRLGSFDPGFTGLFNNSGKNIVASCSNLKPLKRVGLILDALIILSRTNPGLAVDWYHIGSGESLDTLVEKSRTELGNTAVTCFFKGSLSNSEVISFYKKQPIDVFVNVSETEGIPVSIMEIQSLGIPVIATAVGGTPEIVNDQNGFLLSPDLSATDLANVFLRVFNDPENWNIKRRHARLRWEQNFNAEKNYASFTNEISEMLSSSTDG